MIIVLSPVTTHEIGTLINNMSSTSPRPSYHIEIYKRLAAEPLLFVVNDAFISGNFSDAWNQLAA